MKTLIFPLLLTSTTLYSFSGVTVESVGYIRSNEPMSALKIDYSHDFLKSPKETLFSNVSWTQFYKKSFGASLGIGYRYHFPTYSIGLNKFLDISNFSGKLAYQSGIGFDYIHYPFESHLNFYIPYASNYYSDKYKINFHKIADLYASYTLFDLFELIINPSYSFTSQQFGIKGGIGFSLSDSVQLTAFYGNDVVNKNHGVLSLNFGPGPERRRHMTVKRSSHIRHEKAKIYKPATVSIIPFAVLPAIPLITASEVLPIQEEEKVVPIEEVKTEEIPNKEIEKVEPSTEQESPFFLRRVWNWIAG